MGKNGYRYEKITIFTVKEAKEDIKSAIKKLKQRLSKQFVMEELQFLYNEIDLAFEDVMRK